MSVKELFEYPEGTIATCRYCRRVILLDQREGGGPGKDWGDGPTTWAGNGGIGMDYGCEASPDSNSEECGGHLPYPSSIEIPTTGGS